MVRREVSAKEFMEDIKAGMDDTSLMEKDRLTPRGLDSAFRKLLAAGLISRLELEVRKVGYQETVDLTGIFTEMQEQTKSRTSRKEKADYSFSGKVEGVDILDYIQFLLLGGKRTVLEVRPNLGEPCKLFIDDGRVLHAATSEGEGEEVFYLCMRFNGGHFVHLPWTDPEKTTIEKAGTVLLFEAARRRDEVS